MWSGKVASLTWADSSLRTMPEIEPQKDRGFDM